MRFRAFPLLPALGPLFAGLALLLTLDAIVGTFLVPNLFDFGRSLNTPTQGFGRFIAFWLLFGLPATLCLALGGARLVQHFGLEAVLRNAWCAGSDRKWMIYGTIFALLLPVALRTFLLDNTPLTDDEAAYRLMAQVVAEGRVYADSPPLKLFFDSRFLVNDGKLYSHYFLGWPALLVPGLWLGIPGFWNAFWSALTVFPLFAAARRGLGSPWARVTLVLYLASPMLMIGAATETAHTSCMAFLAAALWAFLRSRDDDARPVHHAAFAFAFSVAFFVRPTSALGVGLPFLVVWLLDRIRQRRIAPVVAFTLPALVLAALFLRVNQLQTGDPFHVAYQRAYTYAEENGFRFSLWTPETAEGGFSELAFEGPSTALAIAGAALLRLSTSLFGWPTSLLFVPFAGRGRFATLMWLSTASFFGVHLITDNVGIDTFAPMHFFEVALPLLLLTAAGIRRLTVAGEQLERRTPPLLPGLPLTALPSTLLVASLLAALAIYVPLRYGVIWRVADEVATPRRVLEEAGIERGVIFAPEPFVYYCRHEPTRGWVFVRPNNDPGLQNDLLWVNHLDLERNRLLMSHLFPDRQGYVMVWDTSCRVRYLPLDRIPPGIVPDANIEGIEDVGRELQAP